ncbi:MAG: hypothetical protein EPO40_25050 [Myxococcaceae bacterium]|nr:MAG: hypothetical protein EPO40_25050 [Myxococcaceae bacterium]
MGRPAAQKAIPHAAALAAHLLAGDLGCAVSLEGCKRDRVRGVGFSYRDDAETSRVAIHLADRFCGYEPAEIVGRLAARVGHARLLVTSSGDPRGGYVCHLRVPPMGLVAARGGVATLLDAIGFAPRSGVIEVHPASRPGLLPFGLGGREFFHAPTLEAGGEWGAFALIEHLLELEPLDLEGARPATARRGTSGAAEAPGRPAPVPGTSPLATYLRLVSSGVAIVSVQPSELPRSPTGGWEWRASRAALDRTVETHLHVSATEQPARIGRRLINAVGLSYRADAVIDRGTIDLDGQHGYGPATVVARLAARVGRERLLVTSSSGRAGRYHCHVRFPPMPIAAARAALSALLVEAGFPKQSGAAEVFPGRSNCRLPFGLGGCDLFEGDDLHEVSRRPWQDLTARLDSLPRLDLSRWTRRGADARPAPKSPRANSPAPVNRGPDAEARAKIARWWREGVQRSERNDALFALARDCKRLGLPKGEALHKMQHWIDDGGLEKSAEARRPRGLARQRDDVVPDVVARAYARPLSRVEPVGPVNLTQGEIAYAVALAKVRCRAAFPEKRFRTAVAHAVVLLLDVLPRFKGAWQQRKDEVRLSRDDWTRTLGRRAGGYADVREALRLFTPSAPYVIDECPYTWRLLEAFPFEESEPAHPLVVTRPPRAPKTAETAETTETAKKKKKWRAAWVMAAAERVAARSRRAAERAGVEVREEARIDSVRVTPSDAVGATTDTSGLAAATGWTPDERLRGPVSARPGARPGPRSLRGGGCPQGTTVGLGGPPRRSTGA